jgi:hypothetical protein
MNQLEKLVSVLVQNEFSDIECTEQILRHIEAREGKQDILFVESGIQPILLMQGRHSLTKNLQKNQERSRQKL